MPQSWWEIPRIAVGERSFEAAEQLERILTQMWHFQLKSFLHLPFMLRVATEPRYEYNRLSALSASREVMLRYSALHEASNTQLCCRIAGFAAFIATVTIVLDFLDTSSYHHKTDVHQQDEADKNLVQQIVDAMESLSRSSREKIAAQSVKVIKTLLTTQSTSGPAAENLRLILPFFGTIYISRVCHLTTHQTQTRLLPPRCQPI